MRDSRGSWYLLTGLVLGAAIGLVLSIFIFPAQYVDVTPSALKAADRDQYRALIARAYLVEADIGRAVARLALLEDPRPADALVEQAQQEMGVEGNEQTSRALALLAAAVSQKQLVITPLPRISGAITAPQAVTHTPDNQVTTTSVPPTRTPGATITPRATATAQPTQGAPYELAEQKEVCEAQGSGSLLQVYVFNAAEEGVPAVRVEVSFTNGGVESFYTGLYPEVSPGYADYAMVEGMTYNLRVGDAGQMVQNLSIPQCENENGGTFPGSIQLIFKQP